MAGSKREDGLVVLWDYNERTGLGRGKNVADGLVVSVGLDREDGLGCGKNVADGLVGLMMADRMVLSRVVCAEEVKKYVLAGTNG